jgi:hypothetical protein
MKLLISSLRRKEVTEVGLLAKMQAWDQVEAQMAG